MTERLEQADQANNTTAALAAGTALGDPKWADSEKGAYAVIPEGYELHSLEELQERPDYIRARREMGDLTSLLGYIKRFEGSETTVYADAEKSRLVAVLDHPGAGNPEWEAHKAVYEFPLSRAWQAWTRHDGDWMAQSDFAQHFEDNLPDILVPSDQQDAPSGADMLEVARTLQAKREASFRSGVRLENGDFQISYQEDTQGSAGVNGQLEIPEAFYLGLQVYKNGDYYQVKAKLQYRIREGQLRLRYQLYRPDDVKDQAFEDAVQQVRDHTSAHVLLGRP
jgi:uncharacterized protein YfdQ (DUF2303 family)